MEIRRVILGAAFVLLAYSLWNAWQKDFPVSQSSQSTSRYDSDHQFNTIHQEAELLPHNVSQGDATHSNPQNALNADVGASDTMKSGDFVDVHTDVLDLKIDLSQGDVILAQLKNYPAQINDPDTPFTLLYDADQSKYVANSSLLTLEQQQLTKIKPQYTSSQKQYHLSEEQNELTVILKGQTSDGLKIEKSFHFQRGQYAIQVDYKLLNQGDSVWTGYVNNQVIRTKPPKEKSSPFVMNAYTGASYGQPGHHRYQKLSFSDMEKKSLDVNATGGWIAMQQHYFLTAWIPNPDKPFRFYSKFYQGDYAIGLVSQAIKLAPEQSQLISSTLYTGPEVSDNLKPLSPGLDLTIDYGWLWFISSILFSVMKGIYGLIGNWGWSIVLVTVLIKLAFYRLSASSYRSMAGMKQLQPKIQALKDRYGDDKAKLSQETMALYREEKVNPLSGCLPMLVQIPVFIALYWVLAESVELRQAPFIFWIKDLAMPDPYHVLPLIMGVTMLIQQKLNPTPPDPTQAKVMMFLPVFFTALFWNFPSGLVLYWTVNNTLTIMQQWYITQKYEKK